MKFSSSFPTSIPLYEMVLEKEKREIAGDIST